MSVKLTKKQTQILDFIKEFTDAHGFSPSYREICAGLGLKSPASVAEHIRNLVALGVLKKDDNSPRSLEVVDLSFPETTALFRTRYRLASDEDKIILAQAATILGIELDLPDTPESSPEQ